MVKRFFFGVGVMATVWLGFLILGVFIAAFNAPSVPAKTILEIPLGAAVSERQSDPLSQALGDTALSLHQIVSALKLAEKDERVLGVFFDVRDPQISLAQLEELSAAMDEFRATGKKSLAYLETAGEFSPGNIDYGVALLADEIILPPSADVSLVGLRAEVPFLKGMFDKLKLEPYFEKRKEFKNAPNTFTETGFSTDHRTATVALLESLETSLVHLFAHRLGKEAPDIKTLLDQGPYDAVSAHKIGLVQQLGYYDEALTKLENDFPDAERILPHTYIAAASTTTAGDPIALVYATGTITRRSQGGFGNTAGSASDILVDAIAEACDAEPIALVLRVDSPGGSYLASDFIRRELQRCSEKKIPVIVSMGTYAASGGYAISMEADHIFANPSTLTGSIGVYAGGFAPRKFFESWLGIRYDHVSTRESADLFNGLDVPQGRRAELLSASVDRVYQDFVSRAAKGRGMDFETMEALARGRVWTGRQAFENKLVDGLGGLRVATNKAKELEGLDPNTWVPLAVYPREKTLAEEIQAIFSQGSHLSSQISAALQAIQSRGIRAESPRLHIQ